MSKYRRYEGETPLEFQLRVCKDKDSIGTWQDVTDICNRELGYNYAESKYRKDYASFQKLFNANQKILVDVDSRLKDIEQREFELKKEQQKFFDQRREFNRIAAHEARAEHLMELFAKSAEKLESCYPILSSGAYYDSSDSHAVLFLADWHYGMKTDNVFNKYDTGVCVERISKLREVVIEKLLLHKPKVLHIVCLGDLCHGGIHVSARVQSEELVCDQLMKVSEIVAEFVLCMSNYAPVVNVYSTYGNHMRTIQNKHESVHADNMERVILWWLKERLKNCSNVSVIESEYYEFLKLNIYGFNILCTHGDLDNIRNVGVIANALFIQKYGEQINYTVSADKHHAEQFESLGIDSTIVPALCGSDDYASDKRLYSNAGQTLMFFNRFGKDAVYNIKL